MASFKAIFPVLQELFAKNHRGALWPPPPAGRGLKINIAKPIFRTLFIYQKCSQFDGRYRYIQRYLRAKLGAYRTVCGISGVHNGEAAEFPIHTSLIHGMAHINK